MRITYVCSRSPWPADHGANVRTARMIEALSVADEVSVISSGGTAAGEVPDGIQVALGFDREGPSARSRLRLGPAEGIASRSRLSRLESLISSTGPEVVIWENSLLAHASSANWAPGDGTRPMQIVEFANIERIRYRAMASTAGLRGRVEATIESWKAIYWEPLVARRADGCIALSHDEQSLLLPCNSNTLLVRNGASPTNAAPSPRASKIILAAASWWYEPNRHGLQDFVAKHWGRIKLAVPGVKLRIVGQGDPGVTGDGIEPLGFVDDLESEYRKAAVFMAPALSGAGSQLKVMGALEHARIVIGPEYLSREAYPGLPPGAIRASDDMAGNVVQVLEAVESRNAIELELLRFRDSNSWLSRASDLRTWMVSVDQERRVQP